MDAHKKELLDANITRLQNKLRLHQAKRFNGTSGIGFIFPNKVIKITINQNDAINSYNISKSKDKNIVNVHNVFKFKTDDELDWIYIIISERAHPLISSDRKSIIKYLNTAINIKDKKINDKAEPGLFNVFNSEFKNLTSSDESENELLLSWNFNKLSDDLLLAIANVQKCRPLVAELLNSYNALKRAGFTHTDIHRFNIMKKNDGKICLVDYGIGDSSYGATDIPDLF